jgi:outer membrane protein
MKSIKISAALVAVMVAGGAHAQWADGKWMVGVGAQQISPQVKSGALDAPSAPNTQIDIKSDTQPILWITRMIDDHWSVELPINGGFKHDIVGDGAIAGVGKIGSIKALPITVFGQYRFMEPNAKFRPYVQLGITYAKFYGARGSATLDALNPINPPGGTGLSADSKWALSPGVGVTIALTDKYFADVQYVKTFLKTTSHLSTGQNISTKIDPDAIRIGVGMRF